MFKEAFVKLELADVATILDLVNPLLDGVDFDPVEATIMAHDMDFYPGYRFLDIADYSTVPAVQRFVIYKPDDIIVINWSNEPIYALNKVLPIVLNDENIIDYVTFFFTYVRGRHGRFIITENVDDIAWKEDPPPAARKSISEMIDPVFIKDVKSGEYELEARVMFKDSLFKSDIKVKKSGDVALFNEELLVEDMPVLDDLFGV